MSLTLTVQVSELVYKVLLQREVLLKSLTVGWLAWGPVLVKF